METSIEISYEKKSIYITNSQELENYIGFLMFLIDNDIINKTPDFMSVYYSSDKKITLKTYFINTDLFPDLLDRYKDIGVSPIIQLFLFRILSLYCKVKNKKQEISGHIIRLSVRTYENVE